MRGTPAFGLKPSTFVTFIENHDQVANSGRGEHCHALASPGRLRALTALTLLGPGTPMLFQGQEFAASSPFLFFADHNPELARLEAANTGFKIDISPLEQELQHIVRHVKRVVTSNPRYRHPTAEDRTWPYRDTYLRRSPVLVRLVRKAAVSEALAAHAPFLDMDVLSRDLKVMDASAVALCRDNQIPIVVFSIREKGNLARVLKGEGVQTIVQEEA